MNLFETLQHDKSLMGMTIPVHNVYDVLCHAFSDFSSFAGRSGFEVPVLHYPENVSTNLLLLNKVYAWHIRGGFSQHEVQEWKLLYRSSLHGQNFNTFLGKVT